MTTPFWCLTVVVFIPFILALCAGYFKTKQLGTLDNKNPRIQAAQLEGAGARAVAAQSNAWEALGLFTAVVLIAHLAGADAGKSATASLVFVATRILHPVFYISNVDVLRSLTFLVGLASCVWLVVLAAQA